MELLFVTDVFSEHIPIWTKILSRYAGQPGIQALEIGSLEGRSACWLLENILTHPTARLTAIDLFIPFQFFPDEHAFVPFDPVYMDIEAHFDKNIEQIHAAPRLNTVFRIPLTHPPK
jgi:hypothetical protein